MKHATLYYNHLAAYPKMKQSLLAQIEILSIPDWQKEQYTSFMNRLWDIYPITCTTEGLVTTISFAQDMPDQVLTGEEDAMLEEVVNALACLRSSGTDDKYPNVSGASSELSGVPDIGVEFAAYHHNKLTWDAASKGGLLPEIGAAASTEPDQWPLGYRNPEFPDDLLDEMGIDSGNHPYANSVFLAYNHYFNPDLFTGYAPAHAQSYAGQANGCYQNRDREAASRNFGWACHFMEDVANPMHTGREPEQIADKILSILDKDHKFIHDEYEGYVFNVWEKIYDESITDNYLIKYDPNIARSTREMAEYSNRYLDMLWNEISTDPDGWSGSETVRSITENCLLEAHKRTVGMAYYVRHY